MKTQICIYRTILLFISLFLFACSKEQVENKTEIAEPQPLMLSADRKKFINTLVNVRILHSVSIDERGYRHNNYQAVYGYRLWEVLLDNEDFQKLTPKELEYAITCIAEQTAYQSYRLSHQQHVSDTTKIELPYPWENFKASLQALWSADWIRFYSKAWLVYAKKAEQQGKPLNRISFGELQTFLALHTIEVGEELKDNTLVPALLTIITQELESLKHRELKISIWNPLYPFYKE